MFKKITASVLALLMVFGAGVTTTVNVMPETAMSVSAETYGDYEYFDVDDTVYITKYKGNETKVEIPAEINGKSVVWINDSAFENCTNLTSVTIPSSVTVIRDKAFKNCTNLTSITIPDGVTDISNEAFKGCTKLTSVTIPDSVTGIRGEAFEGTPWLENLRKESPLVVVNGVLFDSIKCEDSYIEVPDGVRVISIEGLSNLHNLKKLKIPASVTYMNSYSIHDSWNCTEIIIDPANPNYSAENGVIYNKDKTQVYSCLFGVESVTIPDTVTSIGEEAFFGRYKLKSIDIPDSVTSISRAAIAYCINLTSITIPDSVTIIESQAFSGCRNLKDVTLPKDITTIDSSTFWNCESLESITIPKGVTTIQYGAFEGCKNLKSVTIPAAVKEISTMAFGYSYVYDYETEKGDYQKTPGFKIYCYAGTAGEKYAIDNGFDYELLEPDDLAGSITFAGNEETKSLKASLTDANGKAYDVDIAGAYYSIPELPEGDYTLTVSADGYVTRDENITIDGKPLELDLKLCKPGDIDGSGKVDITDVTTAIASVRGVRKLDTYATKVGNVAGADDKLDITDVTRLISHVRGVRPL